MALLVPTLLASLITAALDIIPSTQAPEQVEGIDPVLLDAYTRGAAYLDKQKKYQHCTDMRWSILAGIGAIESDHGAGVDIAANGDTDPPFIGPRLDGSGAGGNTTPHPDSDNGRWDGDTEFDRAVGVTQHLPEQWADYGVDANGDGTADPHNVFDLVASTAVELCDSANNARVDFSDEEDLRAALHRYNPSRSYVADVMDKIERYDRLPTQKLKTGGSGDGQRAAQWAMTQLGKPYVWGAEGPNSFDCSGLTMQAWKKAGVSIPRVTDDQYRAGQRIPKSQLQPGDLLFYDTSDVGGPGKPPTHVTLYAGNGKMVNAPSTGKNVRVDTITDDFYQPRFMGAIRPGH